MIKKLLIATLVASSFAAVPLLATAQPRAVVINVAPPAPRQEAVPAPRRGYVWVPGYYELHGRRHVWAQGHWIKARTGYAYTAPRWVESNGNWRMEQGRWARGNRDNDGDGVRNRDDARPNNPNRS
jgi:WXXGXW repeat (2 copies)